MADQEKFAWTEDTSLPQMSICPFCIHKHSGSGKCDAFILGIPDRFLDGSDQHTSKTNGDNGITYEQNPKMTPPSGLIKS